MPYVRCPGCKRDTLVTAGTYAGTVQCSDCATVLRVAIRDGVVAEVAVNNPGGPDIQGLPDDVASLYDEARRCLGARCFTAAELVCRKILMHVAVEKGAEEGKSFAHYLAFLETHGHVAPQMNQWLDLIRQHGNRATHTIDAPDPTRAEGTVMFTVGLLRLVYEMKFLAAKFTTRSPS
jgi:hypothetical protein